MSAFLGDRVSSLIKSTDFFEDPLVKEWLVHFENLIKNAETHQVEVKENTHEQFTVRFLDKSRELVAAIRFKDGVYSCLNSQGEKFFDTVSVMMKDPLCLMLDIRKHGSNKIFGSVGLRIGIDRSSHRPVLLIQGLYFENKTPSFINGILDIIEQQIARKIRAKKIVVATILCRGLPFATIGFKANSKTLFFEIEGTCGVEGSTGYDDIGSINDSNFTFNKPGFIKELD